MVASIRAGYKLLTNGATQKVRAASPVSAFSSKPIVLFLILLFQAQDDIQQNVKYFFEKITTDPICEEAMEEGLLTIPLTEDWQERSVHSHIIAIKTRMRHELYLSFHLARANMNAYSISYPVVPKGESRVRLVLHAHNTKDEISRLVSEISNWASEMLDIERGNSRHTLPSAARYIYGMQSSM